MSAISVPLRFAAAGRRAELRELCGHDEQAVAGTGPADAIGLLDRILVAAPGDAVAPGTAVTLTVADRDRLLAAVHMNTYGSRVSTSVCCAGCKVVFDVDFSLAELQQHQDRGPQCRDIERRPDGSFRLADGRRFRLPTGEDECAVLGMAPEEAEAELLRRCLFDGDPTRDNSDVDRLMEDAGPVLALELTASCPECGREQSVYFDIQRYLLTALSQERHLLVHEIHMLARAYGWSLTEILGLPRSTRRGLVALIDAERLAGRETFA